jgi:hypothetical protein
MYAMKQSGARYCMSPALAGIAVSILLPAASLFAAAGATKVYTLDADFDLGVLFNVNHTAPNNNQLQLNSQSATFPVLWVANAGEDTVSKIDTNTGKEVGRYRTWFSSGLHSEFSGPAPSRTAVDADGNCYVANRHFDGRPASVVKILASGGVDRNGNGVIDTSVDADNNGIISGAELRAITDANANSIPEIGEVADERIGWIVQVGPANGLGRSLSIDPQGNIWVGLYNSRVYYKLNPANGAIIAGPINVTPNTPYGSVVDASGILWGASLSSNLLKLDTNTNTFVGTFTHGGSNYGIGFGNSRVYLGQQNPVVQFNPATNAFSNINLGFSALGVSVGSNGDILVHGFTGGSNGGASRIRPDGSIRWSVPNQAGAADFNGRGCVPDANDDVWTINLSTNNVQKYAALTGAPLGVFPVGSRPYSYSDATGSTFVQTIGLGRWNVVFDTGVAGTDDTVISWNSLVPAGASLAVSTAASNTKSLVSDYNQADYVPVSNGGTASLAGRYHAIQVTFTAAPSTSASPILHDLTIAAPSSCGNFDLNGNGCVDRTDTNLLLAAIRAGSQDSRYDMNCDGKVDIADSRFLATKYTIAGGAPCPAP